ncbi:MAG: FkbM family methyltransferase [Hyphomonadaceae bacterium]
MSEPRTFKGIGPFSGVAPPEFCMDWLGMKTRAAFEAQPGAEIPREVWFDATPVFSDEYYEWFDLAEAIEAARGRFVMLELGAGYGRWCMNAEGLIRHLRPDLERHFTAVEGDPTHFLWLAQHFDDNGVGEASRRLVEAAVAGQEGEVFFAVGDPAKWWGQAIVPQYYGAEHIPVRAVTLSSLLERQGVIDIIDMDIQGAELDVVTEAIETLDVQVRRLHIGTHSQENERGLRALLTRHDWRCLQDFSLQQEHDLPFGRVMFGDGVQSWINPRLT